MKKYQNIQSLLNDLPVFSDIWIIIIINALISTLLNIIVSFRHEFGLKYSYADYEELMLEVRNLACMDCNSFYK